MLLKLLSERAAWEILKRNIPGRILPIGPAGVSRKQPHHPLEAPTGPDNLTKACNLSRRNKLMPPSIAAPAISFNNGPYAKSPRDINHIQVWPN